MLWCVRKWHRMNNLVKFNSDQANETLSRLFKHNTRHSHSNTTYINMGGGGEIPFSSPKVMLGCGAFTYLISSQKYALSFTSHPGNKSCWVSFNLLERDAGMWKGDSHDISEKGTANLEKATLVCLSVLGSLPLPVTHPLPSTTHSESYAVLMPCLPVKGEEAFMFIP